MTIQSSSPPRACFNLAESIDRRSEIAERWPLRAAIRLQRDVKQPVLSLFESFKNRGFLAFVGIWLAINYLIGKEPGLVTGEDTQIAWEAHIGGFLTGLLLFKFFDPHNPTDSNSG